MEQSQLDELYERASEHYLNGRFAEALQSWRQLLSLSPGDERVRELGSIPEQVVLVERLGDLLGA